MRKQAAIGMPKSRETNSSSLTATNTQKKRQLSMGTLDTITNQPKRGVSKSRDRSNKDTLDELDFEAQDGKTGLVQLLTHKKGA